MKRSPLIRKTPMPRPKKRMRSQSPKLAARRRLYSIGNIAFAALPENKWCPVAAAGLIFTKCRKSPSEAHVFKAIGCEHCHKPFMDCTRQWIKTTDTHHKDGRDGKNLLDFSKCIRVSREGHDWIRDHGNEARRRGWLI